MFKIIINEMTYKRPKIKDSIDDHVHQIVENWCLIWTARQSGLHVETINHWANELSAQMDPGLDKLDVSGLCEKAKHKLIDEVLYSDAKVNQQKVVFKMISRKFPREGYTLSQADTAAQEWVIRGLPKVRAVYRGELELNDFIQELKEN